MKIANAQLWVHDQEEALAFYTEKLGMEVRSDVTMAEMGDFRWLAVAPPGQEDVSVVLMAIPGPPVIDDGPQKQIEELMAKGFAGTAFLTTDDCQAEYEKLRDRGVEFTETPGGAALRDRLRVPRSLRQQHPPDRGQAAGQRLGRGRHDTGAATQAVPAWSVVSGAVQRIDRDRGQASCQPAAVGGAVLGAQHQQGTGSGEGAAGADRQNLLVERRWRPGRRSRCCRFRFRRASAGISPDVRAPALLFALT